MNLRDHWTGSKKKKAFDTAELFILPTYTENFGIAIGEALAHGLPVLTTTGAPWPMLVKEKCGWWVEPTVDGIAAAIAQATSLPSESLAEMGARGREFAAREFRWDSIGHRMMQLYEDVITNQPTSSIAT